MDNQTRRSLRLRDSNSNWPFPHSNLRSKRNKEHILTRDCRGLVWKKGFSRCASTAADRHLTWSGASSGGGGGKPKSWIGISYKVKNPYHPLSGWLLYRFSPVCNPSYLLICNLKRVIMPSVHSIIFEKTKYAHRYYLSAGIRRPLDRMPLSRIFYLFLGLQSLGEINYTKKYR